jgi:GDP-mannose 4,6-dehydratase
MKRALITGITGQDGSYLTELLLSKGYVVYILIRRASTFNTGRIDHIYTDPHIPGTRLFLHYGDLSDAGQLTNLIYNIQPDEVYHLGAKSHVRVSFDMPECTRDRARSVGFHIYEDSINKAKELNKTKAYRISQRMRKRIEELFGEAKEFMGLRTAKLRRLKFVKEQILMTATA